MKDNKYSCKIIIILVVITIAAVGGMIWTMFFRESEASLLTPDYAPVHVEENAESIYGDSGEKAETSSGGGSVSISYSTDVDISLASKEASLYFANPGDSTQDMVLQLVIQDTVIIQSGKLEPGNKVSVLKLLDGAEKQLAEGIYKGKFRILFYDPDSGALAMINTEIPVEITVSP